MTIFLGVAAFLFAALLAQEKKAEDASVIEIPISPGVLAEHN